MVPPIRIFILNQNEDTNDIGNTAKETTDRKSTHVHEL